MIITTILNLIVDKTISEEWMGREGKEKSKLTRKA